MKHKPQMHVMKINWMISRKQALKCKWLLSNMWQNITWFDCLSIEIIFTKLLIWILTSLYVLLFLILSGAKFQAVVLANECISGHISSVQHWDHSRCLWSGCSFIWCWIWFLDFKWMIWALIWKLPTYYAFLVVMLY